VIVIATGVVTVTATAIVIVVATVVATLIATAIETATVMIGATEAHVRIPKPSCAFFAFENPMPIESTNGTVTGPVVTPAESQAMLVKFSELKTVRKQATAYLPRMRKMTLTSKRILVEPGAVSRVSSQRSGWFKWHVVGGGKWMVMRRVRELQKGVRATQAARRRRTSTSS
jgi:hypothetical protein